MNDARHDPPTKVPPTSGDARRSIEDLELELAEIEQSLPPSERRVSRPSAPRRESVAELTADLERLSADIPLRASVTPVPVQRTPTSVRPREPIPVVAPAAASEPTQNIEIASLLTSVVASPEPVRAIEIDSLVTSAARPPAPKTPSAPACPSPARALTVPPVPDDFDELPAVLGLLGDDGEIRSAITPPSPPPRHSVPPPIPAAALEDRTVIMQLDDDLLMELDDSPGEEDPPSAEAEAAAPMREPTPVPDSGETQDIASLPDAPKVPAGIDVAAAFDSLPDLADLELGDMHEPSAVPRETQSEDAEAAADLAALSSRRSG